jgi:predicted AlkP superfamily phosphohydrolase/phosphomutase
MTPSRRVLVVGLDMGDGGLIRQWSGRGLLPSFAALEASGAWISLDSPAEALHTSSWPTMATGALPGRHGVYYPYQPKPGCQLAQHIGADQYGVPTFWTVAAHERRVLVYDVPETFPDPAFRGRAIYDWGTWAWYGEPSAQPPSLLRDIESRFGPYPLGLEAKRLAFRVPDSIEQRLLRSIRYKTQTTSWLLGREEWDLAVVAFSETHPAGHYLWPAGMVGPAAEAAEDGMPFSALRQVYGAIDEAVGELRSRVPKDTVVVIVSGDGVRPNRCGWHLLPRVLERLGYTVPRSSRPGDATSGREPEAGRSLLARLHGAVPAPARRMVTEALPWRLRDRIGVWLQTRSIDWSRTRAFTLPTDLEGCIRLNVRGREPYGIVEPGTPYRLLCEEIGRHLEELENPATGRRVVERVWVRNDVFTGPRQEHLPDLMVTWNDDAPIDAMVSPRAGLVEGRNPDPRPGTHSTRGFALAAGGGIPGGLEGQGKLADIAPSVLSLLGVDAPASMDGRPLAILTTATSAESASWRPTEVR